MEKHEPVSQPLPTLRLNLQSLADGYNDSFLEPSFCNRQSDKAKLLGAMVYYGQQELKEEYVYLGAAEVFRATPLTIRTSTSSPSEIPAPGMRATLC